MKNQTAIFNMEKQGDILFICPVVDLGEAKFQEISDQAGDVFQRLEQTGVKKVIVDFAHTDSFGSSALAFFVRLWKRICTNHQEMAFCNLSDHEREILDITKLSHLWPICNSREEAVQAFDLQPTTK